MNSKRPSKEALERAFKAIVPYVFEMLEKDKRKKAEDQMEKKCKDSKQK
jgi:hypothetical protein